MNYYIFDLDDTLLDKGQSLLSCSADFYSKYEIGSFIEIESFKKIFQEENNIIQPKDKAFSNISCRCSIPKKILEKMKTDFDKSFHEYAVSFDGVADVLGELSSRGANLGCLTNGRDFFQRNKLNALGFSKHFKSIITSGAYGAKKPDESIFKAMLTDLGARSSEVAFCGDSIKADMVPAKNLGMVTLWKSNSATKPSCVDYVFSDYKMFPEI